MNAVNTLPTSAQMMPAVTPPMSGRLKLDAGVRNERIHEGEHDRDDRIRHELAERTQNPRQMRNGVQPPGGGAFLGRGQQSERDGQQNRSHDHDAQIFGEAAREGARMSDLPHDVEALFHFLNRADHGVGEERQTDRAEHVAAHVLDELQDALGQLGLGVAQGAEEFVQDESEIGARSKALKNGETEDQQRYDRQQGGVRETHGADGDVARPPVANDGDRVAQQAQCGPPRRPHVARLLEQSVFETFQRLVHGGADRSSRQ